MQRFLELRIKCGKLWLKTTFLNLRGCLDIRKLTGVPHDMKSIENMNFYPISDVMLSYRLSVTKCNVDIAKNTCSIQCFICF
jgi:hypothetical protein